MHNTDSSEKEHAQSRGDRINVLRMNELLKRNESRRKRTKHRQDEHDMLETVKQRQLSQKQKMVNTQKPVTFMAASALLSQLSQERNMIFNGEHDNAATSLRADNNNTIELDFYLTSLALLQSMTKDERTKLHIAKFLSVACASPQDTQKFLHTQMIMQKFRQHHMRVISWPSVVEGVMEQFNIDLPRCSFKYKGTIWNNPIALANELKWDFGPMWSRWICLFSNQAPLADVLKVAHEKINALHVKTKPENTKKVVMELNYDILKNCDISNCWPHGSDGLTQEDIENYKVAHYELYYNNENHLFLSINKKLMAVSAEYFDKIDSSSNAHPLILDCSYLVTFLPDLKITMSIQIK
jgi:hypothetical protein